MKIYRIAQNQELSELMEEARKYDNPEDFSSAYSVKQNLIKSEVRLIQRPMLHRLLLRHQLTFLLERVQVLILR